MRVFTQLRPIDAYTYAQGTQYKESAATNKTNEQKSLTWGPQFLSRLQTCRQGEIHPRLAYG